MLPVSLLFISSIGWGLTWLPLKLLGQAGISGLSVSLLAYGSGALMLLPWLWLQRAIWRAHWRSMLGILLLGGFANLSFATAMLHGEVVRVMVLFYLLPAWSTLGGHWLLGERAGASGWLCVALSLAGALLTLGGPEVLRGELTWVDLLAVGAGLSFAANNLVFRASPRLPLASSVAAMFGGSALMASLGLFAGLQPLHVVEAGGLLKACAFGVGWLLLASLLGQWSIARLEARRAALIILTELVTSVASATWLGGQTLAPTVWAGASLIFMAALLEARREGQIARTATSSYS